jgi:hypothetical protein
VEKLIDAVQAIAGENIDLACLEQGCTNENASQAAEKHGV